ncbi:MAG: (2Fe-2S) ferredoxin domain-containing protein [Bacteriovoracaceae bacterium]|nr:(2Fe-2S) ferredoxin domain-containing protein [Bacteriovoracaceae bacterium]
MKKEKLKSQIEVFVCNHHRDNEEACAGKGAKELTDKLKKWAKEEHKGEIKVYRSGCLGKCSEGIAIACYPEKKFLLEVTADDFKEIKQGLEEAL